MTRRVFGRTAYDEPLTELGAVDTGADVRTQFPGEWVELVAFAEDAIHWIVTGGEEVEP